MLVWAFSLMMITYHYVYFHALYFCVRIFRQSDGVSSAMITWTSIPGFWTRRPLASVWISDSVSGPHPTKTITTTTFARHVWQTLRHRDLNAICQGHMSHWGPGRDPFVKVAFKCHPILAGGSSSWMVRFTRVLPTFARYSGLFVCSLWLVRFRSLHETTSLLRFVVPVRHSLPHLRKLYEGEYF
jgi:hypothetical protein